MPADRDGDHLRGRLSSRAAELIDIASESRAEAALAAHVLRVLRDGGVPVRDAGDTCILAGALAAPRILLCGHLDTVPAQGNLPSRVAGGYVHGRGASDMKGAVAVMLELALDGLPPGVGLCLFGREELAVTESAFTPLLARERGLRGVELAVMMEPTDNAIHAGCVGNINATWVFTGTAGHSARPWLADNAIAHAARAIAALAAHPYEPRVFSGLEFVEAASVTKIHGGIAQNVIPDRVECHVNFRYAPDRSPAEAEARLRELCDGHGTLTVDGNAPSAPVVIDEPLARLLIETGGLDVAPKQAWTPVAELAQAGVAALNFGPGAPAEAHRRDEKVAIAALERCYDVLARFLAAASA